MKLVSALLMAAISAHAASVLTHEAIVDALWDVRFAPILKAAYPGTTKEQLEIAQSYAYGGSILQDLGYYPRGSKEFSDLAHYVRTGDLIQNLLAEAHDVNELAFALGALTHYISDVEVHSKATNIAEPMLYPHLRKKFGPVMTYEEYPPGHLKTEFGFDVLEVARGNFAPQAYHDFIGFNIAQGVMDRALQDTYGVTVHDIFPDFERSIGSYRHDISQLIPRATRIAWAQKKKEIQHASPGVTERQFVYVMRRSAYERAWGKQYDVPSRKERFLAFLLRLLPPIGPLADLKFKMPTPQVEKLFMASFDVSVSKLKGDLNAAEKRSLDIDDLNYDVGKHMKPGEYGLEDDAYADWVHLLAKKHFAGLPKDAKAAILAYYVGPNAPLKTKRNPQEWQRLQTELAQVRALP